MTSGLTPGENYSPNVKSIVESKVQSTVHAVQTPGFVCTVPLNSDTPRHHNFASVTNHWTTDHQTGMES